MSAQTNQRIERQQPDDHGPRMERTLLSFDGHCDRDTTCAIVGGIVALSAGRENIPSDWLARREPISV
jgi:hypothetical protein